MKKKSCYLSGPMRGIRHFGFPAFDQARDGLIAQGWEVISPADLDRELGFDPTLDSLEGFDLDVAFRRDVEAILSVDTIIMLPGWFKSEGATLERKIAEAIGLDVRFWDPVELKLREGVYA